MTLVEELFTEPVLIILPYKIVWFLYITIHSNSHDIGHEKWCMTLYFGFRSTVGPVLLFINLLIIIQFSVQASSV